MKEYPFSRFVRHVEHAAREAHVPEISDGLASEGGDFRLRLIHDNDLFLFLRALEERAPAAQGRCGGYPTYPECQDMGLTDLYHRLRSLRPGLGQPVFDWWPHHEDLVPFC